MLQKVNNRRQFNLRSHFLVLMCLSLLLAGRASLADQADADRTLHSRVPRDVRSFTEQFKTKPVKVETVIESLYQAGTKTSEVRATSLTKKRDQFYLSTIEQIGGNAKRLQYCYGMNSKYCFELKRNKSGSAWVVSRVVDVTPDFNDAKQGFLLSEGFRSDVDKFIANLASVKMAHEYVPIEKLFELPSFQLGFVALAGPNQNVLRASFTYQLTDPEDRKPCRSDCVLEFDLSKHCLPIKFHQSYKNGPKEVTHDWQNEWMETDDGGYAGKLAIDTKTVSDGVTKHLIRIRTDRKISTRDLPESDFTLSAFGFPEPPGVEWKKPFPYYLVAIGVGVVCLAGFGFFRMRARRAARVGD